jgi:hypothetical protein
MIVGDFDVPCCAIPPRKAEPPLIVDADAALALTIPAQSLHTVAWRHAQIVELPAASNARSFARTRP